MDIPVTNPQDSNISSNDDATARRLKNRERQRRYREKKRLRTDTNMVLDTNQFASVQVDVPVIVAPQDGILPMNVASLDSAMPVSVTPLYSTMPVSVTPLYSTMPVSVTPLYSTMPVNVAPQEYVMPVDVSSGECVMPVSSASRKAVTRVYSGRKWKSDARKAQAVTLTEVSSNGSVSPDFASTGGCQAPSLPHFEQSNLAPSSVISSPVAALENNGTPKSIPSRRHWKAEARNKRN